MPRIRIALIVVAILAALAFVYIWWQRPPDFTQPDLTQLKKTASVIRAFVQRDPRFIDVTVSAGRDATIFVVAPAKLSPDARATLSQLITKHASGQKTNLVYVIQAEDTSH